jgi:hypothetical protein
MRLASWVKYCAYEQLDRRLQASPSVNRIQRPEATRFKFCLSSIVMHPKLGMRATTRAVDQTSSSFVDSVF